MSKLHIKEDDTVIVLSGSDKSRTGKVLKVLVDGERAIVRGVNVVARNIKLSTKTPQEGIVRQEAPVHISNLSLIDPRGGKATRVFIERESEKVTRITKKSREEIK